MIGKLYDHNPAHFKFPRTCEGFQPEPEANKGDWLVWRATVIIAVCALVALLVTS